jgi:hypothetical protein
MNPNYGGAIVQRATVYLGLDVATPAGAATVKDWLHGVHVDRMDNWCAAFAHGVVSEAIGADSAVPAVASALRMYAAMKATHVQEPEQGALGFVDHGHGLGHVFIVESILDDMVTEISGNTNGLASRNGGLVMSHWWNLQLARGGMPVHGGKLVGFALPWFPR